MNIILKNKFTIKEAKLIFDLNKANDKNIFWFLIDISL